jgi:long-chain fatty acid transport protein
MSYRALSRRAAGALGFLVIATGMAQAGGLAIHEQSPYGQGASFAGIAAGGALSSMFWNPATMTQQAGLQSESAFSGIFGSTKNNPTSGPLLGLGGTGNVDHPAVVPASYYSYQVNPNLWLGLSITSPFGIAETFPDNWAGRAYAAGGENLMTFNFNPSVAYKINDMFSVGVGLQVQYAHASFTQGILGLPFPFGAGGPGLTQQGGLSGSGYGFGWTAGVTVTPTPTTSIGIGYRSGIDQKINGTLVLPGGPAFNPPFSTPGSINTSFRLPGILSVGLRQRLTSQWTALATVEWTNWARIGTSPILQPNGAQATLVTNPIAVPFEWKDGWFYSAGAEYEWSPQWTLRGGIAWEKSPVTDAVRGLVIPDNDRLWLSAGASWKYNSKITFDLAYSHGFVRSTSVNLTDTSNPLFAAGKGTYTGTVDTHFDIFSIALRYRFDTPAAAVRPLITKG